MNKKAEAFKKYLEAQKFDGVFSIEELANDEWETALFRSQVDINGNKLPTVVIFDKSVYGLLRVLVAPQVLRDENETAVLKLVNEYNKKYKAFKYYLDDAGSLVLDICMIAADGKEAGEKVYAMYDVIIQHLNDSYKEIMKSIWG
ncbi:MAG: YbjN domain-containing protein [Schwartzia sp. (in: firmicutes)]